jgi:hypothetical protein
MHAAELCQLGRPRWLPIRRGPGYPPVGDNAVGKLEAPSRSEATLRVNSVTSSPSGDNATAGLLVPDSVGGNVEASSEPHEPTLSNRRDSAGELGGQPWPTPGRRQRRQ